MCEFIILFLGHELEIRTCKTLIRHSHVSAWPFTKDTFAVSLGQICFLEDIMPFYHKQLKGWKFSQRIFMFFTVDMYYRITTASNSQLIMIFTNV